jgi:serine/threonine protein kinase
MNTIDSKNYIYIEKIGYGKCAEIYKVKNIIDNKFYALKFEKIIDTDIIDINSRINREINFYNNFGNKYSLYFTKYYGCYYENKTMLFEHEKLDININIDEYDDIIKNYIEKHKKSNIYISKVYDLVDTTLDKIILKLDQKKIYSMILQLTNIIKLLHKNNYIHGDFHSGNIGVIYTKDKYVNINGIDIPTYGYIYKVIDLSFVLNKTNIINVYEQNIFDEVHYNEYLNLLNYLIDIPNVYNMSKNNMCKYWSCIQNKNNILNIDKFYDELYKNKKIKNIYDNKYINLYVYYLDSHYTYINKTDIIYILDNIQNKNINYDNIILYFTNKINKKDNKYINILFIFTIIFLVIFYFTLRYRMKYRKRY